MNVLQFEIAMVMAAVAVACTLPGVFLVLRKLAMTADAIGHTLILGIVIAYAVVRDLSSPLLALGASLAGVLTVFLIDLLRRSPKIKQDAAIGLVFPALFALGTILASLEFRQIHLDVDAVLLGQVEYSYLTRATWPPSTGYDAKESEREEKPAEMNPSLRTKAIDLGPRSFVVMTGFTLLNALLVAVFYKELKLTTFDPGLAFTLGFAPAVVHFVLITLVSLTAVAAFDAVGPVLVVAFFVAPAATAHLLTNRLCIAILLAVGIAILAAFAGTAIAFWLDTTIAGTVATLLGALFGVTAVTVGIKARTRLTPGLS